jgi:Patatin-like phospholipase
MNLLLNSFGEDARMGNATDEKPAFHIGLALAGAVSAGAYSAGVLDFLIEALSEWQKAKARGEDVPQHDVFISAISGTSAGGITAALGLAALAGGVRSVETAAANPHQTRPIKRVLPELYDVWVKNTKLFAGRDDAKQAGAVDGYRSLLDIGDLQPGKLPTSLLNSEMLTRTARATLSSIRPTGVRYPFFTNPTHLFLTHTNLDGVPYPIVFGDGRYFMNLHEDRSHFAVTGLGERQFPEEECQWLSQWGDTGQHINVASLGRLQGTPADRPFPETGVEALATAALTTSAFPFGLRAREVSVASADIRRRALPFDAGKFAASLAQSEPPAFPTAQFVCVDGGALNNEPFELVRWTIRDLREAQNPRDPIKANRAVILIAPFPPEAKLADRIKDSRENDIGLWFVAKMLLPALIEQARFKVSDLIAASDPDVYSRFLVSPKRSPKPEPTPPKKDPVPDLACGLLQAFGGFLDEQFREHDFQLGRRNCQWFLRRYFTLHPDNPVFGQPGRGVAAGDQLQIVPLLGSADEPIELPPWPKLSEKKLADLCAALERRLDPLIVQSLSVLLKDFPILRFGARLSWRQCKRDVVDKIMNTIRDELETNDQLERVEGRRSLWSLVKGWLGFGRPEPLTPEPKTST